MNFSNLPENSMKIFCLYYKDIFVVAFPNREDCVSYGKKHYEGLEWDCNIVEKYLHNYPTFLHSSPSLESVQLYNEQYTPPITQKTPHREQNVPDIWCGTKATTEVSDRPYRSIIDHPFMIDHTQLPKINEKT